MNSLDILVICFSILTGVGIVCEFVCFYFGRQVGREQGFDEGYDVGFDDGFSKGYRHAVESFNEELELTLRDIEKMEKLDKE